MAKGRVTSGALPFSLILSDVLVGQGFYWWGRRRRLTVLPFEVSSLWILK